MPNLFKCKIAKGSNVLYDAATLISKIGTNAASQNTFNDLMTLLGTDLTTFAGDINGSGSAEKPLEDSLTDFYIALTRFKNILQLLYGVTTTESVGLNKMLSLIYTQNNKILNGDFEFPVLNGNLVRNGAFDLIKNGYFNTGTLNWTSINSNLTRTGSSAGQRGYGLNVTNNTSDYGYAYQEVIVTPNVPCVLNYYHKNYFAQGRVRIGTTPGGAEIYEIAGLDDVDWTGRSYTFTPTVATIYVNLGTDSTTNGQVTRYDEINLMQSWDTSNAAILIDNPGTGLNNDNYLVVTNTADMNGYTYQEIQVTPGMLYTLGWMTKDGSSNELVTIGTTPGASDYGSYAGSVGATWTVKCLQFIPDVTSIYINFGVNSASNGATCLYDDITISSGWIASNVTYTDDTTGPQSGNYCAKLVRDGSSNGFIYQIVPVTASVAHNIKSYRRADNSSSGYTVRVGYTIGGADLLSSGGASTTWSSSSNNFTPGAGRSAVCVSLWVTGADPVYFDNIVVK
jgi:hypothetical protein